jgi:hypothetical protein
MLPSERAKDELERIRQGEPITAERHSLMRLRINAASHIGLMAEEKLSDLQVLLGPVIPAMQHKFDKDPEELRRALHRWNDARLLGTELIDAIKEVCDGDE